MDGETGVVGDANLTAGRDLKLAGKTQFGGKLAAQAGNDLAVAGETHVTGDTGIQAGRDVRFEGGLLAMDGGLEMGAGMAGAGSVLGTPLAGTDLRVKKAVRIQAPDAIGSAAAPVELATDGDVDLQSRRVFVAMTPISVGKPVNFRITGVNQGLAEEVGLDVSQAGDLVLKTLRATVAGMRTDSGVLKVVDGFAGDYATFRTPFFSARVDHLDRAPRNDFDARGFTLTGDYELELKPNEAYIGAFVINQNPRKIVTSNPGGNSDQESGKGLLNPPALPGVGNLFNGAPASGGLVTVDPTLMDEERLLEE